MVWTLGVATLGGAGLTTGGGPSSGLTVEVAVEIAFTSGYLTPAVSRTWTDVTDYVEGDKGISIQRGRGDQFSSPQPSRLTVTLDNKDGRFTPENAAGANYPNVKQGRPIRVRVRVNSGSWVTHFLGYVNEWPVDWPDGVESFSTVTVTAMSRQARLGRGSTLRSIVEEEILYDAPVLYYPLGEPSGATTAGNIAPGRSDVLTATQLGTGGTVTFGQGTGPGTDDLSTPVFTRASASNGLYLMSALSSPVTGAAIELECFFTASTDNGALMVLTGSPGPTASPPILVLHIRAGAVEAMIGIGGAVAQASSPTATASDGNVHHAVFKAVYSAGSVALSVIYDGTVTSAPSVALAGGFTDYTRLFVGGTPLGSGIDLLDGGLSHATVYAGATAVADARFQEHYLAGSTGFTTDASGARVARYARLAGIPSAEISVETGLSPSIAHKDTTGELPIALMQDVAETEDGVVFDGRDGTLTFHARSHRYGSTSAFTLDCDAGDIETGLLPRLDDQHLTNDMTASRPNGITVRSTNAASITEYGTYRESLEVLTTSDNEVQARADWEVNRFGNPRVAIPNVRAEVLTSSVALDLLSADIGTRFTLTNLPSQAPATTMDFFVEGVTEEIGPNSYYVEFNVSAAAYANVWQLDSATNSQLDSTAVLAY